MSSIDPAPESVAFSEIPSPPLARLPDPERLFETRAARFRALAEGHALGPYLAFLAELSDAQGEVAASEDLAAPEPPSAEALERSKAHGMPALDSTRFATDPAFAAVADRLIARAQEIAAPDTARSALAALAAAGPETRGWMAANVVAGSIPPEEIAEHVFVAAALQIHAARAASRLDAKALVPVGDGVCPACGGAPSASLVVGWEGAHGARYCSCSLCGTLWNYVRIRCTACGSTKGITYQEVEGGEGLVRAECCGECGSYLKLMTQTKNPALDPVADDVATTDLDILVTESGVRRSGQNPFLLGY